MTGKYLTPYEKGLIDTYRLNGKSISVIARLIGRSNPPFADISKQYRQVKQGFLKCPQEDPGKLMTMEVV